MANRHLARTMVMQVLYEWDFREQDTERLSEIMNMVREEFAPKFDDDGYVESQVHAVIDHLPQIDALIADFSPNWTLETMTAIDRTILRLGVYELQFDDAIPAKVAINEAIELGKTFGGDASGKFVNGVLGAMVKDMQAKGHEKCNEKESSSEKVEKV